MFDDDAITPARKAVPLEIQLENASIDELEARIDRLRGEIAACESAIAAKRAQRAAADSVFSGRTS